MPRPSELLCLLGKKVPPLDWIIKWFLLYPCGKFPNAAAWACYFINFIYLLELILGFLIFYYILDDLYQWFKGILFALWQIYITAKLAIQDRRNYLMDYDEMQLANHYNNYVRLYKRADANRANAIGDEMLGASNDIEANRQAAAGRASSPYHGIPARSLLALAGQDTRLVGAVLDQAGKNERLREQLGQEMEALASDLGVQYVKKTRSAHAKKKSQKRWSRSMHQTWERIAAPMAVPMHLSHSYVQTLVREEDARREPALYRSGMP